VFVQEYGSERGFNGHLLERLPSGKLPLLPFLPSTSLPIRCITEIRRKQRDSGATEHGPKNTEPSASKPKPTAQSGEDAASGNEVILLVEDEVSLRTIMQKVLQQCGYRVIAAENPTQAVELWLKHREEIQLVLTDVMMQGMTGVQLVRKLRADNPALKVVYTSGFTKEHLDNHGERLIEGMNFVPKPFRRDTLTAAVRRCFDND